MQLIDCHAKYFAHELTKRYRTILRDAGRIAGEVDNTRRALEARKTKGNKTVEKKTIRTWKIICNCK
jgi:hypothetical protein